MHAFLGIMLWFNSSFTPISFNANTEKEIFGDSVLLRLWASSETTEALSTSCQTESIMKITFYVFVHLSRIRKSRDLWIMIMIITSQTSYFGNFPLIGDESSKGFCHLFKSCGHHPYTKDFIKCSVSIITGNSKDWGKIL